MVTKISCYFERIKSMSSADDLDDLITLHIKSFEQHGWEVVMLDESAAKRHPLFSTFDDPNSIFASSRNPWEYTRACYMRWLAYASAGHFFADLDVINYGLTPQDAQSLRKMAGGPTFLSIAGAAGLFQKSEYRHILNAFLDYKRKPFISGGLEDDVNDMNILAQSRPDLYSLVPLNDTRIAREYTLPGWETAQLVHYAYHFARPPRSSLVRSVRPLMSTIGTEPSKTKWMGNLISRSRSVFPSRKH